MASHPDYPCISSKNVRGQTRWRFMGGKWPMIPGEPHTPIFDAFYEALVEGRDPKAVEPKPTAKVMRFTGIAHKTLDKAWSLLRSDSEHGWKELDFKSQRIYSKTIERILDATVDATDKRYGGGLMEEFERRHVKAILKLFEDTPHMERTVLLCLRKLVMVGIEEEWIKTDPTYGLTRAPTTDGHATWLQEHLDAYEAYWPVGSPQRIAYALALWLGNRVSDVARLRWEYLMTEHVMYEGELRQITGFRFTQFKGRKKKKNKMVFLPWTPMLESELVGLPRSGPVLESGIKGRAYTDRRLSEQLSKWAKQAGLPDGYTAHGLRKALAVKLAHSDASSRAIMLMLGHTSPQYVELYTREVDEVRMAAVSAVKLTKFEVAKGWSPEAAPPLRLVQ